MYNYPGQQQLPLQQQQTGFYNQQPSQQPPQFQAQPTGYPQQYQTGIAPQQTGYQALQYVQQPPQQPQQFLQSQSTGYPAPSNYGIQQSIPQVPALPQQFTTYQQQPIATTASSTDAPATSGNPVRIPNGKC